MRNKNETKYKMNVKRDGSPQYKQTLCLDFQNAKFVILISYATEFGSKAAILKSI